MKKSLKKCLSVILALSMMLGICTIASYSVAAVDSGDYTYTLLDDGTAEISQYNGTDTDITIPNKLDGIAVTSIGARSFESNKTIENVVIPEGVTNISDHAFWLSANLTTVSLPDTLKTLGDNSFSNLPKLEGISIPDGITDIPGSCFQSCNSATTLKLPKNLKTVGDMAFVAFNCKTLDLPSGLTEIGQNAFAHCTELKNLVIPDNVTLIKNGAFSYCEGLTSITIPDSVKEIQMGAFSSCTSLMELTCPKTVETIGKKAFGYWFDKTVWNDIPLEGFVLKGYKYSPAYYYAEENGFEFDSIGEVPTQPTTASPTTVAPSTTETGSTVEPTEPIAEKTIYFKNSVNWSKVNAYIWDNTNGNGKVQAWPGTAMTKLGTDNDGDTIYSIAVDVSKYDSIIFNNGSTQTVDIRLSDEYNAYYCTTTSGKLNVQGYTYSQQETTEPTTEPTTEATTEVTTTVPETTPVGMVLIGDVNNDGAVSVEDASAIQKYLNEYQVGINELAADVDGDGEVNINDATLIQKYLVGMLSNSNINTWQPVGSM